MARITEHELRKLVDELGRSLVLFARQWCSCPDDALQEALIELATSDPPPRSVKAWLFRVVRNKAMNQTRADRRRNRYETQASNRDAWFENDLSLSIDAEFLVNSLERLPDIQRQIVTTRIWGELTYEQISEIVDRPTATVYRLFREAIESMRSMLHNRTVPLPTANPPKP